MNSDNNWKKNQDSEDHDLSSLLDLSKITKLRSNNPMQIIRKNLVLNVILGSLICIGYLFLLYYFPIWQIQLPIAITLIFSVWAVFTALQEYKKLNPTITAQNSVLDELNKHKNSMLKWMEIQLRIALFIYPVSATGGFMLGGVLGSEKSVEIFMAKPMMWVILILVLLVLVPVCHYCAKWMFKQSFGKHLEAIEQNILDLQTEK
jgi:hypothetical protein